MIYLVAAILVFEILRLVIQLVDGHMVKVLNEQMKVKSDEWKAAMERREDELAEMRKQELANLTDLAKASAALDSLKIVIKQPKEEQPK